MFLRTFKRMLAVAGVAALSVGVVSAPAQATGDTSTRLSGRTTVVTAPGVVQALLGEGILPVVTRPGKFALRDNGGVAIAASFPVTGGSVSLDPPSGKIYHKGGIKFINVKNGQSIEVGKFTINLDAGRLTGVVNRSSTRVAIFNLDLSNASITTAGDVVTVRNVGLNLTAGAAGALNDSLGVDLFSGGLTFGTAKVRLELPRS
jgi:hypothetical protein